MLDTNATLADVGRWQEAMTIKARTTQKMGWAARIRQHDPTDDPEAEEPELPEEPELVWQRSIARALYQDKMKQYEADKRRILEEGEQLFAIMHAHISEAAQDRLSQRFTKGMWNGKNPGTLMDRIRATFTGTQTIGRTTQITIMGMRREYTLIKQANSETVLDYQRRYKGQLDGLVMAETTQGISAEEKDGRYGTKAVVIHFIMSLNRARYGDEQMKLEFNQGDPQLAQLNPLPANLDQAVQRACGWEAQYMRLREIVQRQVGAERINAYVATKDTKRPGGGGGRSGGGGRGEQPLCRLYQNGNCRYGDSCRFRHEEPSKKAQPAAADDVKKAVSEVRGAHAGGGPAPKGV